MEAEEKTRAPKAPQQRQPQAGDSHPPLVRAIHVAPPFVRTGMCPLAPECVARILQGCHWQPYNCCHNLRHSCGQAMHRKQVKLAESGHTMVEVQTRTYLEGTVSPEFIVQIILTNGARGSHIVLQTGAEPWNMSPMVSHSLLYRKRSCVFVLPTASSHMCYEHTVDRRNPVLPEKPWNDDCHAHTTKQWCPAHTTKQWFQPGFQSGANGVSFF